MLPLLCGIIYVFELCVLLGPGDLCVCICEYRCNKGVVDYST